jgi:RimJ/RimL family protein N-acetyltransferase
MVNYNNERAIRLYEKFGFEREGVKRHALRVDGRYIDAFSMANLLGPNSKLHRMHGKRR